MKNFQTSTRRSRVVVYAILTVGLGLVELFRAHGNKGLSWGDSLLSMLARMLMYAVVFVVLEVALIFYNKLKK